MKVLWKEVVWLLAWLGAGFLLVPLALWLVREPLVMADPATLSLGSLMTVYRNMFAGLDGIGNWLWLLSPYALFLIGRWIVVNSFKQQRDPKGYTKLGLAVCRGDTDSIQSLIEGGAEIGAEDGDGRTPLHLAAMKNRVNVIRLLLERGADIDAMEPRLGLRPLHISAREGNREVCEVLIRHGADIDSLTLKGETALHYAVEHNHDDVVLLLLKYRARADIRNNDGMTPLQCAMDSGYIAIADHIRQHVSDEWPYLQLSNG